MVRVEDKSHFKVLVKDDVVGEKEEVVPINLMMHAFPEVTLQIQMKIKLVVLT
jgi:hypothetical protein